MSETLNTDQCHLKIQEALQECGIPDSAVGFRYSDVQVDCGRDKVNLLRAALVKRGVGMIDLYDDGSGLIVGLGRLAAYVKSRANGGCP